MKGNQDNLKYGVYKKDARKLDQVINAQIVDVTITSPPYYNLKDYGYKEQIGFGQNYNDYLNDLKTVFEKVYDCTKDSGSLWVIIDAFRLNNDVVPLPFDFANKIKEIGWKLQDVIIWAKDRTVPWAHKGQMRNLFEYILVFSKTDKFNFYIDEVRDFEVLKKWWVKYPERYNPKGKIPSGLWHFDIPTQGSWGKGYIKHFCPLPEEMIGQILKLTSKEGNVVLDPFAGSGAVLAKANTMNRNYIGFELNGDYIKMFKEYQSKTGEAKRELYLRTQEKSINQKKFENLILDLRVLKYARVLFSRLPEKLQKEIVKIYAIRIKGVATKKNARCIADYTIYASERIDVNTLNDSINRLTKQAPLSKFGIEANFFIEFKLDKFLSKLGSSKTYTYTDKATHKFKSFINTVDLQKTHKSEIILSKIKVDLLESDFE
jgi:DNA modification methylase